MTDYSVLTGNPFASLHTGMASGDEVPRQSVVTKSDKDAAAKKKKADQTVQGGKPQTGNQAGQGKGAAKTNQANQQQGQGAKTQGQNQAANSKQGTQQGNQQGDSQGQGRKKQKFVPIQANMSIAGSRSQDDNRETRPFNRDNQEGGERRQGGFRNNNRGDNQGGFRDNRNRDNQEGGERRQGGFRNNNRGDNQEGGFRRYNNRDRDNQEGGERRQGGFRNNNRGDRDNQGNRDNNNRDRNYPAEQGPFGAAENAAFNAPAGDQNLSSGENFDNFQKEGAFGRQKRNNDKNREGGFAEGDRQINDFRGRDARYNRANDHGSSERSYQRREAAGFQRRDGSVRGDGARHDRRPKNAYHRTNGGQRDNAKGGAGGHNWGMEGSELNDAEFAEGRSPTIIEPKVVEGQGITEADVASPLPEGSTPATPSVEGAEKKEGEGSSSSGDKRRNNRGEESDEEPDNTVSYEEYTKQKAEASKGTLPKLPEPRKVEAGEVATGNQIKRATDEDLYGAFVPRPKGADKKKPAAAQKKKPVAAAPVQPEFSPIQFEIRDTSRDGRGRGRGGRGGYGGDREPRRFDNNRGGRGGKGGRVDFGNKSFPSLSPSTRRAEQPAASQEGNNASSQQQPQQNQTAST